MKRLTLSLCLLLAGLQLFAQKTDTTDIGEYVITDTRFLTPIEKSGKMVYKINQEAIKNSAGRSVADLINDIPAIQTDGNFSTPGTNLEYYVRGSRSRYTLVLIDGVPMNDPTGINLFYDLRYLPINQVESIEVVKGGLSALYGSNAAAGVINIKLKDNASRPVAGSIGVNGGSFGALGLNGNVNGTSGAWNYGLSINRQTFDGFSAAQETDPAADFDKDGFEKNNLLFKGGYKFNQQWKLDVLTAYDEFTADLDAFAFTDDPDAYSDYQQLRVGLKPEFNHAYGRSVLNVQLIANERDFRTAFPNTYEGKNVQVDQSNSIELSKYIKAMFGWNLQYLEDQTEGQEADFTIFDPYASLLFESEEGLNLHVGVRLNTHSDYDNKLLATVNPSWLIELNDVLKVKPFASLSTAYNTPSLYQLNNQFYGNSELNPEETLNIEFGTSFYANDKLTLNAAFFRRNEDSAIDFRSFFDNNGNFVGGEYFNLDGRREVQGLESDLTWKFNEKFTLTGNYSKLATNNDASFARIPKEKWGLAVGYSLDQTTHVQVAYQYTGERRSSPFSDVFLNDYRLVNFTARKELLNQKISVFGAVNNLFDEDFIGVEGYTTMGRNFNIGLEVQF
ncbi:TonB-dependent receptor plug domain-containing protein [Roseivirga sp.]|uniref:TonB-dependent receptor plug domain-containing protein n=1 Tax=Roseivirga sp. TaxID=1964215 RepID=UPI003B51586F